MKKKKPETIIKKPSYITIKLGAERYIKMQRKTFILAIVLIGLFSYLILSFSFHWDKRAGLQLGSQPAKIKSIKGVLK